MANDKFEFGVPVVLEENLNILENKDYDTLKKQQPTKKSQLLPTKPQNNKNSSPKVVKKLKVEEKWHPFVTGKKTTTNIEMPKLNVNPSPENYKPQVTYNSNPLGLRNKRKMEDVRDNISALGLLIGGLGGALIMMMLCL